MNIKKELQEAIDAANNALERIDYALKKLSSARKWGFIDLFGGETFSSVLKHGKMDAAADAVRDLQGDLSRFQNELNDVNRKLEGYKLTSFGSKFIDIAFDNVFSDWSNQRKIKNNIKTLKSIRKDVVEIREDLKRELKYLN